MPTIVSITNSGITGVDLSNAVWRLQLKETAIEGSGKNTEYYFGISYAYPPADMQLLNFSVASLIRTHILVAEEANEVSRIASVALDGGSLDKDKERTSEAFSLFKNRPRIKSTALDEDIKSAHIILEVYWKIQEWIMSGMAEEKEIIELGTKLILRP